MANKTKYSVAIAGAGVQVFSKLPEVISYVGFPVTRKGILGKQYRGITMWEEDVDGNIVPNTFGGLPLDDPKYAADYAALEGGTDDTQDEPTDSVDDTTGDGSSEHMDGLTDDDGGSDDVEDDEPTDDAPPVSHARVATPNRPVFSVPAAIAKVNSNPKVDNPEYPEKGYFKDEKAIKKHIKNLTDDQLVEWAELEGIKWNRNENPGINRMRVAMAIKAFHGHGVPQGTGTKKSKGKYSHIPTEVLVAAALDNDITIRDDKGDERILRMYTIMALREAGILDTVAEAFTG